MSRNRFLTGIVIALTGCAVPDLAGPATAANPSAVKKTPYFRARHTSSLKPRQSGAPAIVNAASFEEGVSPGGLATIFGQGLTSISGTIIAQTNPLPDEMAGVQVFISGFAAPLYSVTDVNGEDQISLQVPYEVPTGPSAAEVQVYDQGSLVADCFTDSFTEDPGIFVYDGNYAIMEASDYSLIGPNNPAIPGEPLVLYTTGLGPLDQDLVDGYGSPTSPPFAETVDPFQVIVDNENCDVFFSGLAPGFVGLYQVNFYVPQDALPGNLPIFIQSPYATSSTAVIPVQ